jgi:hypothetical protein
MLKLYIVDKILYNYKVSAVKGWIKWQEAKFREAHDKIKKALIENDGLTKTEIHKKTGLSRVTIDKHLHVLENEAKKVVEIGSRYHWRDNYEALIRCLKADALLFDELDVCTQRIKFILDTMSLPKNLWRFRQEGITPFPKRWPVNADPKAHARLDFETKGEWQDFFSYKEKVYGELHDCFFSLAQVVVKAAVGSVSADDDLSNVTVRFVKGRASWTVDASGPGRERTPKRALKKGA